MKTVLLQIWEEADRNIGTIKDGCSLHIDDANLKSYIDNIYIERESVDDVPDVYKRIVGSPILVEVSDNIYNYVNTEKSVKLETHELNNLINLEEIIVNF